MRSCRQPKFRSSAIRTRRALPHAIKSFRLLLCWNFLGHCFTRRETIDVAPVDSRRGATGKRAALDDQAVTVTPECASFGSRRRNSAYDRQVEHFSSGASSSIQSQQSRTGGSLPGSTNVRLLVRLDALAVSGRLGERAGLDPGSGDGARRAGGRRSPPHLGDHCAGLRPARHGLAFDPRRVGAGAGARPAGRARRRVQQAAPPPALVQQAAPTPAIDAGQLQSW